MSEFSKTKFEETQNLNLNLLLGKRKLDKSSSYQNSVWMAHWNKHQKSLDSDNKSRFEEQLIIGMNHHRTSTKNSKMFRTSSDEIFDFSFKASQILESSENSELKWGDFPMYGIKQKIESLLNPKRKGKVNYDDKVSELNFTFQSSKEYRFDSQTENPNNNFGVFQNPNPNCSCTEEGYVSTSSQVKCPSMNSIENSKNSSNLEENSSNNRKKSASLFEMVSLPSNSFDMKRERKPKSCLEDFQDEMIYRKDEGLFRKSDTLVLDSPKDSRSSRGLPPSGAKKAMVVRSSKISNSIATPRNAKPLTKDKQIIKSPDPNLTPGQSGIFTLELDSTESQILAPNSNPEPKDSVLCPNPINNTWLKRLKQNNQNNYTMELDLFESQILPPNSNTKPKDSILSPETNNNTWLKRLRQNNDNKINISDGTLVSNPKRSKLENNNINNANMVSEQSVKSWIQRWTVAKKLRSEICEQNENSLDNKEDVEEKQFPSIHALAMMGKAMNKFRPCEFQRRGPSVVWNSNEF